MAAFLGPSALQQGVGAASSVASQAAPTKAVAPLLLQPSAPAPSAAVARGRAAVAAAAAAAASRAARRRCRRRGRVAAVARAASSAAAEQRASRIVAVVGRDGGGKSKVCAALLDLAEDDAPPPASPGFADKGRLLEREAAEGRRNFTCYNHFYSQQASVYHSFCPRLHLIDTPGHVDRLLYVDEALRVAHGAAVVCSVRGGGNVGSASGHIFDAVKESGKPMVIFLNGVDTSDDADDFEAAVDSLEESLGSRPLVLFAPVHASGSKAQTGSLLLNVLDGTVCSALECSMGLEAPGSSGGEAVPPELASWAEGLREQLLDALSAADDELMEAYVEYEGKVPRPAIDAALRRAAAAGRVVPLVAGSAKIGLGVDALQEVIQTFIPVDASQDVVEELGVKPSGIMSESLTPKDPFLGWAFGRRQDSGRCLLHVRVLRGHLHSGKPLKLVGKEAMKADVPGEIFKAEEFFVHGPGGELDTVLAAGPGDLVYVPVSSKSVPKGRAEFLIADSKVTCSLSNELGAGDSEAHHARQGCCTFALQLGSLDRREQDRLLKALETIREDDAGLRLEDNSHGETLFTCMGLLHLELLRERLAEEFKILRLPLGQPHVEYRATLKETSRATGQHQLEGKARIRKGQMHKHAGKVDAWAKIELEPGRRGSGVDIDSIAVGQQQALSDGIRRGLETAGPSGIPVVDVRVRVLEAEAQSPEAAVEAAATAVQKAVQESQRVTLLEPIVNMELDVPTSSADNVLDDLQKKRRGLVCSQSEDGHEGHEFIGAEVPLREIRGYSGELQKLTGGEGFFTFQLQGYREVLPQVEKQIMEEDLGSAPAA